MDWYIKYGIVHFVFFLGIAGQKIYQMVYFYPWTLFFFS